MRKLNPGLRLLERGDTIIEVMIALAILGLAFSLSYGTANHALITARNSQEHSEGLQYLQSQLELLRADASDTNLHTGNPADTFCMDSNPSDANYGKPIAYDPSASPNPCQTSVDGGAYTLTVTYQYQPDTQNGVNQDVYTFTANWQGIGTLGQQQERLVYKLHTLTNPGTPTFTGTGGGVTPPPPAPACIPTTVAPFTYQANAPQTFTVPSGCSQMTIQVAGAQGGDITGIAYTGCGPSGGCVATPFTINGGRGGEVTATIPIGGGAGQIPGGSNLDIYVAKAGTAGICGATGAWGFSSGGDSCGGTSGGGASAVVFNGTVLAIGAGGGGVGKGAASENSGFTNYSAGGDGGGLNGSNGLTDVYGQAPGTGGTQAAGGIDPGGFNGTGVGTQTQGGTGEAGYCYYFGCFDYGRSGSGGGGGGWWGGGAGDCQYYYAYCPGGGGGSSYANASYAGGVGYSAGTKSGDGQVTISYK